MMKRFLTSALAVTVAAVPLAASPVVAQEPPGGASTSGFLTGPADGEPSELAVDHLTSEAATYGLDASDVAELTVRSVTQSRESAASHVNINQQLDGLEVFGADLTVTVAADGSIAFVGGTGVSGIAEQPGGAAELDPVAAVEAAADALDLDEPDDARVVRRPTGPAAETVIAAPSISDSPIPAKLGWQPVDSTLRLAWQLVIDDASDVHLWNATVDATTGELLDVDDWTSDSDHQTLTDFLRARGDASTTEAVQVAAFETASAGSQAVVTPVPVDDGSSYNVFALPRESPNDGGRTVVSNPADALASPFGWHDTDGAPGPEFTTTRGNNTHAYFDQDANNQPDPGFDVDGGPNLTFDAELDHDEHAQTYRDAVLTNLFYWCNVSHDVFYRYGFDEVSGNFQANNYGRGGVGGDYVRCEAADGGGTNNANFSTPANDGGTPRMQMYLWPGNQFGSQNEVIVDGVGTFGAAWSRFSAAATNAGLTDREIVVAGNGCAAAAYPAALPSGPWMAIVDGVTTGAGSCTNVVRGQVAQALGADALLVASTATSQNPPILTGAITLPRVEIPVVSLTQASGDTIKGAVAADTTIGTLRKNPEHPGIRDGDLEAGIIVHEYSHGVSNRLTGGPGVNCLSGQEQMGEGWSDYHAIAMLIDPTLDDPEGPRGMGPYALFQADRTGNGIRPRPYSRDMTIQPFTYDRIMTGGWLGETSLSVPHGIGHTWAATLWDVTWDLIDRHGFNPNIYEGWETGGNNLAYQLVMDGLKIQGCGPGFVIGRDAIITADQLLTGGENECSLWTSFARRGLGFSAVQGTTDRNDNTEAFDVPPWCSAPGSGLVGPQFQNPPALNVRAAGSTLAVQFNLGGDLGADPLKSAHSPASQQISCATLEPLQYAITEPTNDAGTSALRYHRQQQRYQYNWQTREDWVDTCRQLLLILDDGTQHRANFRFTAG
jgi:extracellular elastinolytic metalloproteinase